MTLLDEISSTPITNLDARIVGVLSITHPEALREAFEYVKTMEQRKQANGS